MRVTVFTRPSCVQCTATFRALDSRGVPYESVDVSVDAEALERVKALGYLQAPVVIWEREAYPAEHVSGFRPDFVQRIAEYREMRAASIDEMGDE